MANKMFIKQEYYINEYSEKTVQNIYDAEYIAGKYSQNPDFSKPLIKQGYYGKIKVDKIVCLTRCSKLDGEMWRDYQNEKIKTEPVEVSNYGRVRLKKTKEVLVLYEGENSAHSGFDYSDGYLKVKIPSENGFSEFLLPELVAVSWLKKPEEEIYEIIYINANPYDNTPENIAYVTKEVFDVLFGYNKESLISKLTSGIQNGYKNFNILK